MSPLWRCCSFVTLVLSVSERLDQIATVMPPKHNQARNHDAKDLDHSPVPISNKS
jgi:hypothetical protein